MIYVHPVESSFPDVSDTFSRYGIYYREFIEGSRVPFYQLLPVVQQSGSCKKRTIYFNKNLILLLIYRLNQIVVLNCTEVQFYYFLIKYSDLFTQILFKCIRWTRLLFH